MQRVRRSGAKTFSSDASGSYLPGEVHGNLYSESDAPCDRRSSDRPPLEADHELLKRELTHIKNWLKKTGNSSEKNLIGLALSGGGIRSATFSLGVLQALARHGILKDIHYLSTVSGGGY